MSLLARLFAPTRPTTALEIAPGRVTALRLSGAGDRLVVAAHASAPLPDGVVVPSLTAANLTDLPAVAAAVREVLREVGGGRRVALVLPDAAAKVSLVRLEHAPSKPGELDAMLRWQVRKSVPFRADDAAMTWAPGAASDGSREFIVVMSRRDVIEQYEAACADAGAHAGIVDLATFNLVNLALAGAAPDDDWLLVHLTPAYSSLAIVRRGTLVFYRHRGHDDEESLDALVHQTRMYYEDRLAGRGFARVLLAGASARSADGGAAALRRDLEDRLGVRVEPVDALAVATLAARIDAGPELRDRLAPLVGVLARERTA
jgi:Tfp pilus assembly PilM family ATPase